MNKQTIKIAAAGILAMLLTAGSALAQGRVRLLGDSSGGNAGWHVVPMGGGNGNGGRSTRRPAARPAPKPRATTPNAYAFGGGSGPRNIVDWYNMDRSRRATVLNEQIHTSNRTIQDLEQRRRHALYTYQHGGGYTRDLNRYHLLGQAIRAKQIQRTALIRNYYARTIYNLRIVISRTTNPQIHQACRNDIAKYTRALTR